MKKFFYGFKEYMMCFLIAAGSSALSLLTINVFLARLMFTIREAEFMDLMDKLVIEEGWNIFPILSQILPFAVATGLIIYYVAPFYNKSATEIDEKVGARVVRGSFCYSSDRCFELVYWIYPPGITCFGDRSGVSAPYFA
jgi:hypothetical protein